MDNLGEKADKLLETIVLEVDQEAVLYTVRDGDIVIAPKYEPLKNKVCEILKENL